MNLETTALYTQVHHFSVNLGSMQVEVVTKPGLPNWSLVFPSTRLFVENAVLKPDASMLLFGCHLGAVAAYLAHNLPQAQIYLTDQNHTSLEMARLTLEANHIHSINVISGVELPENLQHSINLVYIQIPKGRLLARRWLIQAFQALENNGYLYLAGPNSSGIQSVIKDAQDLFGNSRVLAYKRGNRVAQFTKKSALDFKPEWAQEPGIAPGTWVEFPVTFGSHTILIRSLPGVFSYSHLDEGTRMLLSAVKISAGITVLDIGCGYGVIGLYAVTEGAGSAHLVDNDLLAVASSNATLAVNHITNAHVFAGDLLDPVRSNKYDLILSNPPFHAGQAVDYQVAEALIEQSYQTLHPGGQLTIVANRFIRYDRLVRSKFGNVSILAESGKFHVLSGLKFR